MTPGMSWLWAMRPSPIWPTRIRSLAPNAREGRNMGTTAPAAAVFRTLRREIMAQDPSALWKGAPSIFRRRASRAKLLVAQSVDGIELRGLARRIQPEHDAHARAHGQRDEDDL